MGITVGRFDFKDTLLDLENGDIKGTTTQIVDSDNLVTFLVKTKGKSSSCRFVDDTEDVETGNGTGILGSLTLCIIEISRNSDN